MHNGYAQAEGVDNLDGVPATGCLVSFGSPKFKGGVGGYARYVAICPPLDHARASGSPAATRRCPSSAAPLHWDPTSATASADHFRRAPTRPRRRWRRLGA